MFSILVVYSVKANYLTLQGNLGEGGREKVRKMSLYESQCIEGAVKITDILKHVLEAKY